MADSTRAGWAVERSPLAPDPPAWSLSPRWRLLRGLLRRRGVLGLGLRFLGRLGRGRLLVLVLGGVALLVLLSEEGGALAALADRSPRDQLGHRERDHRNRQGQGGGTEHRADGDLAPARRSARAAIDAHRFGGGGFLVTAGGSGVVRLGGKRRPLGRELARDPLRRPVQKLADQRDDHRGQCRGDPGAADPELRGEDGRRGGGGARNRERPHVETPLLLALIAARRRSHPVAR